MNSSGNFGPSIMISYEQRTKKSKSLAGSIPTLLKQVLIGNNSPDAGKSRWATPLGIACKYLPRNFEDIENSCQQDHSLPEQYWAEIGGWCET